MENKMEKKLTIMESEKTFGELIKKYDFIVPDYQRAYSWDDKQLIPFVKDILEHCDENDDPFDNTKYYLGHYILEMPENSVHCEIIDGQQRISTVYLFLIVCGFLKGENYINEICFSPVSFDKNGLELIKSILNTNNEVDVELKELLESSETSSLKKMINAIVLFKKAFSGSEKIQLDINDIDKYIEIINNAFCSVAIFKDKAVASQIFELHNTRGVKLTETEKIKALLMKNIYINSKSPDADINEIQKDFAFIFKFEEKANEVWLRGEMPLDTILMYHLRAIDDGNKIENFSSPMSIEGERGSFEYVKESLTKKSKEEIVKYSKKMAKEFARTMEIISLDIPDADKQNKFIGDVLLLDKPRSIIFLLRAYRSSNEIDCKLIERWENFLMCYDIIYWNGFFYGKQYRGDFERIFASLKPIVGFEECSSLLVKYYKGESSFGAGWGHLGDNTKKLFQDGRNRLLSSTYGWNKAGYFLYKYEMQNKNGESIDKIRAEIFKDDSVSIDHIVARGLSWESIGFADYDKLTDDDDDKKQAKKLWEEIMLVINGIGNLALSTTSSNSSDSNSLPESHIKSYENAGMAKTVEQVKDWVNPEQFVANINQRSELIIEFILKDVVNRTDIWE